MKAVLFILKTHIKNWEIIEKITDWRRTDTVTIMNINIMKWK